MKTQTLALDVYGTLMDTTSVKMILRDMFDEKADQLSELWRSKQLEYSFRRGLMNQYVDFSIVTQQALEYAVQQMGLNTDEDQRRKLIGSYERLSSFADVKVSIVKLKNHGFKLYAYSNGSKSAVSDLLKQAEILESLDGVVSMEDVKSFKPNPTGYKYFNEKTSTEKSDTWMVSGNSFDVIGAANYGMKTVWLKRDQNSVWDPMGFEPTIVCASLFEIAEEIESYLKENEHGKN